MSSSVKRNPLIYGLLVTLIAVQAVSFQYVFDREFITYQKLIMLGGVFLIIVSRPLINREVHLYLGMALFYLLSVVLGGGGVVGGAISYLGLALPWLFYSVRYTPAEQKALVYLIALLGALSVFLGGVFQAAGLWEVFRNEYTGVMRLQGATIPAHFAFLCFCGLLASMLLVVKGARYGIYLLVLNIALIFLSGTRMGIGLSLISVVYMLAAGHIKVTRRNLILFFAGVVVAFYALYLYLPAFFERTFSDSHNLNSEYGINASGRFAAWEFFIDLALERFWFGWGLGEVVRPFEYGLTHFGVPHNEFIRFFYEGGVVGVTIFISSLFLFFWGAKGGVGAQYKRMFILVFCLLLVYSLTDNVLSTLQFTVPFFCLLSVFRSGVCFE